jgi:two-component system sensor histidine kinase DesK
VLRVSDNGCVKGLVVPGNGLNGMTERISALSGKLRWGAEGGGFFLEATLPLEVI